MTINGIYLYPNKQDARVDIGGVSCSVKSTTSTQILCTMPPGSGSNLKVNATCPTPSGNLASNALTFSYTAPSISSLNPPQSLTQGQTVTIYGANFGTSADKISILWGSTTISSITIVTVHSAISFNAPPGDGNSITVSLIVNAQQSSSYTYPYAAPSISRIEPLTGPTSGNITITIYGANFGLNPIISFNGNTIASRYNCTHVLCYFSLPQGFGSSIGVMITANGRATSVSYFSYSAPTVYFYLYYNFI